MRAFINEDDYLIAHALQDMLKSWALARSALLDPRTQPWREPMSGGLI
jgi:hypothetical protein